MSGKEKLSSSTPERSEVLIERNESLYEIGSSESTLLKDNYEKRTHRSSEKLVQDAKNIAEKADKVQLGKDPTETPAERRLRAPSKNQRAKVYKATLSDVREEMGFFGRTTSKIIHAKIIESSSDFVGSTIARPNALLTGSIVAFLSVIILYFIAKNYGYQLSGFETIGAFLVGWVIGIIYDYLSLMIRGKNRHQ